MSEFERRWGFARAEATLANWRTLPYARYAFQNTREFVPTAIIPCAASRPEPPTPGIGALRGVRFGIGDGETDLAAFLEASFTDVFVAMRDGTIVSEWFAPHADPAAPHLLFSITKSVTGLAAGILEEDGVLDPEATVADYLPEMAGSGFADATVRDLLDMRVSLEFDESYLDRDGDYDRYRRAMLWNPARTDRPAETLTGMLAAIPKGAAPHGGPFHYRSPATDVLGLVVERVAGEPYADFLSRRIWRGIGAGSDACITLDAVGAPRGAGGLCATARDLARLGEALRLGGLGVISRGWIEDMRFGGDRQAWLDGNYLDLFPDGRYRNCWYATGYENDPFCAIGIHGQWLYVDPAARVTIVKLSSQPTPGDDPLDQRCLGAFRRICAALGS